MPNTTAFGGPHSSIYYGSARRAHVFMQLPAAVSFGKILARMMLGACDERLGLDDTFASFSWR